MANIEYIKGILYPMIKKQNKAYGMQNSDAISILNCALDNCCLFYTWGLDNICSNIESFKNIGCESEYFVFKFSC